MPMEGHADVEANVADDHPSSAPPLPPPPGRQGHDTYIVQFPKDQVYRVPPRENALIVEQYRNPATAKKRRGGCCCCCGRRFLLTLALIVVAVIAVVGITLATLYFIFNPKGPTFTVSNVAVKKNNSRPQYEVSLRAKNPNGRLGIDYESGDVSLMFGKAKVAAGKFPTLEQGRDESSEVKVELSGSNGALPKGDAPVALKLEMKIGVRVTTAGLETWVMRSNVVCEVKVSGLGNDTRVLSQKCDAKFKQY